MRKGAAGPPHEGEVGKEEGSGVFLVQDRGGPKASYRGNFHAGSEG
jgi:hypothetical protein